MNPGSRPADDAPVTVINVFAVVDDSLVPVVAHPGAYQVVAEYFGSVSHGQPRRTLD